MPTLALLLLLAPEQTFELKLRFDKGMVSEETSTRRVTLKAIDGGHIFRFDKEDECVLRRTVVEVGPDGLPAQESVEVVKSVSKVNEAPDDKTGTTERPSQGKTFTWRRKREGFGLFDGQTEVSEKHPEIVQRMKSGGAARLPAKPVAVGETWEVKALDFVESDGKTPPEGLDGNAVFKLEEVKDGVARISFELKILYKNRGKAVTETGKGVWLFDVTNGREVKLEGEGKLEIENAEGGFGTQKMSRAVTYR